MNVAVIGTGYVGLTTAISLALQGHRVVGVDLNEAKIKLLQKGESPIYEPGMEQALRVAVKDGLVSFTTQLLEGAKEAQIIFICVGTPSEVDGSANLSYLFTAVEEIKRIQSLHPRERVVVIKSTVPVGTTDQIARELTSSDTLHVVSNPEFLREGSALHDAMEPSRIVIGAEGKDAFAIMAELYTSITAPRILTSRAEAEMIKYAANAFLATRISFMNELARLCTEVDVDIQTVAQGMGLDSRIGPEFLRAGLGYGGSCFPKDTVALLRLAKRYDVTLTILERVREVNDTQTEWFFTEVQEQLQTLEGKRIALLGLAFKPQTDDIREAPSLRMIPLLLAAGAEVCAYDPIASPHVRQHFPDIEYTSTPYEALRGADAGILVTEWKECTQLDWERVKQEMAALHLFDGRNAWPSRQVQELGFTYRGVGRS